MASRTGPDGDATALAESGGAADAVAATLADAAFAHVVVARSGDAVAAGGLLGRALSAAGTPFQVSVADTPATADQRFAAGDDEATRVAVGLSGTDAHATVDGDGAASHAAFDAAAVLDADPDPALALAGAVAADDTAAAEALAEVGGLDRRPGVAVPTADLTDGLAHSTLVHGPFSGDEQAAGAFLAGLDLPVDLDDEARRRVAGAVVLDATDGPRSARAVSRALAPHDAELLATAGGLGDVLDAAAAVAPGAAVTAALGGDTGAALDAWRTHGTAVHEALRRADPERHPAVEVLRVDAPARATARLYRDFRAREGATLVVGDDLAALATGDADARDYLAGAADAARVAGTTALAVTDATDGDLAAAVEGEL